MTPVSPYRKSLPFNSHTDALDLITEGFGLIIPEPRSGVQLM
jgi:hypothetical protein